MERIFTGKDETVKVYEGARRRLLYYGKGISADALRFLVFKQSLSENRLIHLGRIDMDSGLTALIVVGVVFLLIMLWAIGIYNKLVALRNRFKNAFAQIDVQLKRRYDLIPNLVEVARKYMAHERETLEAVIGARNQASQANSKAAANPADASAIKGLLGAEGALGGALGRLFAVVEGYPDLKANENMKQLSEELTSTENKVAFARQAYNDSVMNFNTTREVFPNSIIAGMFGFQEAALFEIENVAEKEAPKVSF